VAQGVGPEFKPQYCKKKKKKSERERETKRCRDRPETVPENLIHVCHDL
jgi:hypothetical protein